MTRTIMHTNTNCFSIYGCTLSDIYNCIFKKHIGRILPIEYDKAFLKALLKNYTFLEILPKHNFDIEYDKAFLEASPKECKFLEIPCTHDLNSNILRTMTYIEDKLMKSFIIDTLYAIAKHEELQIMYGSYDNIYIGKQWKYCENQTGREFREEVEFKITRIAPKMKLVCETLADVESDYEFLIEPE